MKAEKEMRVLPTEFWMSLCLVKLLGLLINMTNRIHVTTEKAQEINELLQEYQRCLLLTKGCKEVPKRF